MPYEEITFEEYKEMNANLKPLDLQSIYDIKQKHDPIKEDYCDGD